MADHDDQNQQHLAQADSSTRGRRTPYERKPPASPEALFSLARATRAAGRSLLVITDFDATISHEQGDGDNPFTTHLDVRAGQALLSLQRAGQPVGIISNRAAGQIVRRCAQAGFEQPPLVVGTYGFELKTPAGQTIVDARFTPYRALITDVLRAIREGLLARYGLAPDAFREVETTIPTSHGPIYLEIKGQSAEYPEGLAQEYNLNRIPPAERTSVVEELRHLLHAALSRHSRDQIDALSALWGVNASGDPGAPGRFSWTIRPTARRGKAYGFLRLLDAVRASGSDSPGPLPDTTPDSSGALRLPSPTAVGEGPGVRARLPSPPQGRGVGGEGSGGEGRGLIIYAGNDRAEDGPVMWAGKVLERVSRGSIRFAGVLAHDGMAMPDVADDSDFAVAGVRGVAELLTGLASTVRVDHP